VHYRTTAAVAVALFSAACGSAHSRANLDNAPAIAALHANLRVLAAETTWVTRGTGYELIGRTKVDLAAVQPQLNAEAASLNRIFPNDTLTSLVVTTRRLAPPGKGFLGAAAVPTSVAVTVVEVVLPDPKARSDNDARRGAQGRMGEFGDHDPTVPVVRAWLSAHATKLTHTFARPTQTDGEVDDPRVPAWAESMIPALGADSLIDRFTVLLAERPQSLYPLSAYFTMQRPEPVGLPEADRGSGSGRSAPGGTGGTGGIGGGMGGGRGGMGGGGRGGMGGRGGGGMGGRGGSSRGGQDRSSGSAPMPPLQGGALFDAQSVVFGRYLSRQGYDLIGALVDVQILAQPIDSLLAKHNFGSADQMEADWRRWLNERASALTPRIP
jgi:hypothetical protein